MQLSFYSTVSGSFVPEEISLASNFRACVERGFLKSAIFVAPWRKSLAFFPSYRPISSLCSISGATAAAAAAAAAGKIPDHHHGARAAPTGWVGGGGGVGGGCQCCEWKLRTLCESDGDG